MIQHLKHHALRALYRLDRQVEPTEDVFATEAMTLKDEDKVRILGAFIRRELREASTGEGVYVVADVVKRLIEWQLSEGTTLGRGRCGKCYGHQSGSNGTNGDQCDRRTIGEPSACEGPNLKTATASQTTKPVSSEKRQT